MTIQSWLDIAVVVAIAVNWVFDRRLTRMKQQLHAEQMKLFDATMTALDELSPKKFAEDLDAELEKRGLPRFNGTSGSDEVTP